MVISYYDVAQICLSGHIINEHFGKHAERNRTFCHKCGEKTITQCPSCKTNINGYYHLDQYEGHGLFSTPSYCHNCGKPYPWTDNKIQTAIQIFAEFGKLDENEKETIEEDIKNISRNIPQSELSALRIKKIWKKYGQIAYGVVMDFASKTTAEILKNP
ncbi:MAG: DUF2321 domain-containing protein [Phycisphaerae bacterium]